MTFDELAEEAYSRPAVEQARVDEAAEAAISDAEELLAFEERRRCAHHGRVDCETCLERDLEARGT